MNYYNVNRFFGSFYMEHNMSTQLFFVKQCNAMWFAESAKGISESKRA